MKLSDLVAQLTAELIREGDSYVGYFDQQDTVIPTDKRSIDVWKLCVQRLGEYPNDVKLEVEYEN